MNPACHQVQHHNSKQYRQQKEELAIKLFQQNKLISLRQLSEMVGCSGSFTSAIYHRLRRNYISITGVF